MTAKELRLKHERERREKRENFKMSLYGVIGAMWFYIICVMLFSL